MSIDMDKLLRLPIPRVRQTLTPNDIALYALSIGMGHDPQDARQLPYVDPLKGPVVMPAMVLVMAHPGFHLGHPESGVDPKGVLHADQSIDILGPLPSGGEVESRTRITDVVDKGPGKPALIMAETELSTGDRIFARLNRITFIRGGGGFGGAPGPKRPPPRPARRGPAGSCDRPRDRGGAGAALSPQRRPEPAAQRPGSGAQTGVRAADPAPALHHGVVCHALLPALGDYRAETMRQVALRFSKPVYPGETIRTEIWNDGRFRALVPARDTPVIDGGIARFDPPTTRSPS